MVEQIRQLLAEISRGVYEKENEIALSLLASLAGESILLLGPPGVAKSMVARRLKLVFSGARAFEYLMSRFSTPDEIFGPVSISRLKEADKYERIVQGYLPSADIVFLDEIWKAGPAIQNTLLTAINEKVFRNGENELRLPLKLLVGASNELPAHGEGLEALWDRFLLRIVCHSIQDEAIFHRMLLDDTEQDEVTVAPHLQITEEEYTVWQQHIRTLPVPPSLLECITDIRRQLSSMEIPQSDLRRNIYVSDRRWKHIVRLLKASAFLHDRTEVHTEDLLVIYHCLWNEPEELPALRQLVIRSLFARQEKQIASIAQTLKSNLKSYSARQALEKARHSRNHRDDDLLIVDHFYFQLENHGTGHTFIFLADFMGMNNHQPQDAPHIGVMYTDPLHPERTLIRTFADSRQMKAKDARQVRLYRDDRYLYIDGVRYGLRRLRPGEKQSVGQPLKPVADHDYETELEEANHSISQLAHQLYTNLFLCEADKKEIEQHVANLRKQIAFARLDARKLLYGDEA